MGGPPRGNEVGVGRPGFTQEPTLAALPGLTPLRLHP